jgi:glutaredoxin 3
MNPPASVIVLYSSPFCGYCAAAKRLLANKGVTFEEIDVMFDSGRRAEMIARSGRHTVPQIFVGNRHIGGFDDLSRLDENGELDGILTDLAPASPSQPT